MSENTIHNNSSQPPIEHKKLVESSEIQYGSCRYCKQMHSIEVVAPMSAEQLDDAATQICSCSESKNYRTRKSKRIKIENYIDELFGEASATAKVLKNIIPDIANGAISSVTIDTGDGYKAKIQMTGKGTIKVERNVAKKATREVEYE